MRTYARLPHCRVLWNRTLNPCLCDRVQMKRVVMKQNNARFYCISAYVLSLSIVALPLAVVDTVLYGTIVYWYDLRGCKF